MEEKTYPIPNVFLATDTQKPIPHCIQCDHDLMLGDRFYMIEKIFKKYPNLEKTEILFEYAVCVTCYEAMKDKLSVESRDNLANYMLKEADFESLMKRIEKHPDEPEAWLTHCLFKGTPKEEMTEFQVGAYFKGDRMVTNMLPPFLVGGAATEEMNALLSKETQDEMDDFVGQHFGIPPELRKDIILI